MGPLIFSNFINDLHESLKCSDLNVFADDLKLLAIHETKRRYNLT